MSISTRRAAIATIALAMSASFAQARSKRHEKRHETSAPETSGDGSKQTWPAAPPPAPNTDAFAQSDKQELRERIESVWLPLLDAAKQGKEAARGMLDNTAAREALRADLAKVLKLLT